MRPKRHEHCSILSQHILITSSSISNRRNQWTHSSHPVPTPSKLYNDGSPCPPIGRVISHRPLKAITAKSITEIISNISEMICIEPIRFNGLYANKRCRRWRKPICAWAAEAPWQELVAEKPARFERARGYEAFAEGLASFYSSMNNKYHPLHRVSFSENLARGNTTKLKTNWFLKFCESIYEYDGGVIVKFHTFSPLE